MDNITDYDMLKIAIDYYSANQLSHALRVAQYAVEEASFASDTDKQSLWTIGLLHDILKNTSCSTAPLAYCSQLEINSIKLLTQEEEDSYEEYIVKIALSNNAFAKAIKRADIKDHLLHEETLTEELKNKYYSIIKYLL
jgi:HD superfamily phosphodiesterase